MLQPAGGSHRFSVTDCQPSAHEGAMADREGEPEGEPNSNSDERPHSAQARGLDEQPLALGVAVPPGRRHAAAAGGQPGAAAPAASARMLACAGHSMLFKWTRNPPCSCGLSNKAGMHVTLNIMNW